MQKFVRKSTKDVERNHKNYFPSSKIIMTGPLGDAVPGLAEEETKNVKGSGLGY